MKAKLIKQGGIGYQTLDGNDYYLILNEKIYHTNPMTSELSNGGKLSLKNCQAIELGYDLDKLAELKFTDTDGDVSYDKGLIIGFKEGFQKALELMDDKKFSEEDVKKAIELSRETHQEGRPYLERDEYDYTSEQIIQSLQQTEWDVEIVMDRDCYSSAGRCDKLTMGDCIICTPVTYLKDENGCLILKKI